MPVTALAGNWRLRRITVPAVRLRVFEGVYVQWRCLKRYRHTIM
jgi:hypothetical protein